MGIVGCKHNAERIIKYPESIRRNKIEVTLVDGDLLELICLEGCPKIFVHIKSQDQERRTKEWHNRNA